MTDHNQDDITPPMGETPKPAPQKEPTVLAAENAPVAQESVEETADSVDAKRRGRLSFRTLAHIAAAMQMLTRFRLFQDRNWPSDIYRESIVWFPFIGVLVGTMGAAVDGIGSIIGLTPFVTAPLAIAAMIWMTGALHEGGLANLADGFGGGEGRDDKLKIMQDSRIGTYGTIVLGLLILTKAGALASFSSSDYVFAGLVVSGAFSRALIPAAAAWLGPARGDDPVGQLGEPSGIRLVVGLVTAAVLALLLINIVTAVLMLVAGILAALAVTSLASRQIGGFTRDVLSAVQQCAEIAMLVMLVAAQS